MKLFKKPETYIGAAALALCAGLANCPDKVKSGPSFEHKEVKSKRVVTRTGIEEIFEDLGGEDMEPNIDVPTDEDGRVPGTFNKVEAVRKCIQDSGGICFDSVFGGGSTCFNGEANADPIYVTENFGFYLVDGMLTQTSLQVRSKGKEYLNYEFGNSPDSETLEDSLNQACKDAIERLDENIHSKDDCDGDRDCIAFTDELENALSVLLDNNDEMLDLSKELGFEIQDEEAFFTVDFEDWSSKVTHSFTIDRLGNVDEMPTVYAYIEVTGPNGLPIMFNSPYDAMEYLVEIEQLEVNTHAKDDCSEDGNCIELTQELEEVLSTIRSN